MRLDESLQFDGNFWLPGSPDQKRGGTLTISDDGSAKLKLHDRFSNALHEYMDRLAYSPGEAIPPTRILGQVEKQGSVTLDHCFTSSASINLGGISPVSYFVGRVICKIHLDTDEELQLNEFEFTLHGLDEWIGESGFQIDSSFSPDQKTTWIHYQVPDDVLLTTYDDIKVEFTYGWWIPGRDMVQTEASIRQEAKVWLTSNTSRPIDDFISTAIRVRDFISLGAGDTLPFTSLTGYSDKLNRKLDANTSHKTPLATYFDDGRRKRRDHSEIPQFMPFSFAALKDEPSKYINEWLDIYGKHTGVMSAYFNTIGDPEVTTANRYISIFRAIESLHRETSDETKMKGPEWNDLKSRIRKKFEDDKDLATFLIAAAGSRNSLSARERLIRVFEMTLKPEVDEGSLSDVCSELVKIRNDLAHIAGTQFAEYVISRKVRVKSDGLDAVLRIWLMKMIGFDDEMVSAALERATEIRRKVHVFFAPEESSSV